MNSNLVHNILNVAIAGVAAATAGLIATGCTTGVTGTLDCAGSWVDPTYTAAAASGLAVVKTVINVARDGFGGLIKKQPPVK